MFASTNVDDALVLSALFADPTLPSRTVIAGQFVGMGTLVLGSLLAALGAFAIPAADASLFGCVPLSLGLWRLFTLGGRRGARSGGRDSTAGVFGAGRPQARFSAQLLSVTGIIIANGGDNMGAYAALFAREPSRLPVYVSVFMILTGAACLLSRSLVENPLIGRQARRIGRVALPFVLITVGLGILFGRAAQTT